MLPTMILQPSDFANFDSELSSPNLLPEDATQPEIGFADLLALGTEIPYEAAPVAGEILPAGGNTLPAAVVAPLPDADLAELQGGLHPRSEQLPNLLPREIEIPVRAINKPDAMVALAPVATAARPGVPGAVNSQQLLPDQAGVLRNTGQNVPGPVMGNRAADPDVAERMLGLARSPADIAPAASRSIPENITATVKEVSQQLAPIPNAAQIEDAQRMNRTPAPVSLRDEGPVRARETLLRSPVELTPTEAPRDLRPAPAPVQPVATPAVAVAPTQAPELPQPGATSTGTVVLSPHQPQAVGDSATLTPRLAERIDIPVRDPAWGDQLGQRLQMMASNKLQMAEIRLTPAELGPLRVQVAIDDGAANVTFHAQHAVTREAIEQALPRLREMLSENGLTLNQADIGEQGAEQGNRDATDKPGRSAAAMADTGAELELDDSDDRSRRPPRTDTLVDTFA